MCGHGGGGEVRREKTEAGAAKGFMDETMEELKTMEDGKMVKRRRLLGRRGKE